ncbi:response regulator transcription factor [uncultured Maribacter sp.]|uniref:response regulator n=1 Tax=uncultured Maribacter sp. TaxID=431308 RepID=UPI002617A513|nr:response regulator transcription factor [uncultured Maribacter sp.]
MKIHGIKVVVVDDHPLVQDGLQASLAADTRIQILGSFSTGKELMKFLKTTIVNVVVLDINLPDYSGIELCSFICDTYPHVKILALSNYSDPSIIKQMLKNGAKGYLLKNVKSQELALAIKEIYNGNEYLNSEIKKILADAIFSTVGAPRLTRREKHVLQLIAAGKTTNTIAEELFISKLTVETHRKNIMKKMKVSNAAGLVKMAYEKKLI